jgi:hypothetical protein
MSEMKVKATIGIEEGVVVGYYDGRRRREGEIFEIKDIKDFSHRWMEAVNFDAPPPSGPVLPKPGPDTAVLVAEQLSFKAPPEEPAEEPEPEPEVVEDKNARRRRRRAEAKE